MKASFHSKELLASLAELERLAQKHSGIMRLAAAPSDQLSIDLAAILASEKSRSAPQAAMVEAAPRLTDNATPNHPAPSPSRWRATAAPTIVIAVGLLVGVAGIDALSRMAVVAPQAPLALSDPPETTAVQTSAEGTANNGLAAEEPVVGAPPAPAKTPAAVEPAAVAPLAAAKTLAEIDRFAPAATPSKLEAPAAEITKPVKKTHKAATEESPTRKTGTERHAKPKLAQFATPREAPRAASTEDNADAEPTVISDARRVTQTISGVFNGWAGVGRQALR